MKYIFNTAGIVFFINGRPAKIEKNSPKYPQVIKAFDLDESEQEDAILAIINPPEMVAAIADGFVITPTSISYQGESLPAALVTKIRSILAEGLPISFFESFWANLRLNPSSSSVNELYDFLSYKELPITEDGCFLAYKGVQGNLWSKTGNPETNVLKGQVDSSGRIFNGVGEVIELERRAVDDNRDNECSFGLHVGSLRYAEDFGRGGSLLVIKVNPKDVVSVPKDYNCQKCRVAAYTVVSVFEEEIVAPVTTCSGKAVESETKKKQVVAKKEHSEFTQRVGKYLLKKSDQGNDTVSVKAIRSSFSPEYPSEIRVLDAVSELGYFFKKDDKGKATVLV